MLSYRHHYHAGNFADVFKHGLLIQLIHALKRKDKPFFVLDTHAGGGRYDLRAEPARAGEHEDGIGRLWNAENPGPLLADYLARVRAVNATGELRWYPGSPRLVRDLLRPDDRLVLSELHNTEIEILRAEFSGDRQVEVRHADGYAALAALLPPRERRVLVFIDPAYERQDEFNRVLDALALIRRRWPSGITAIWYPILERAASARFLQAVRAADIPAVLCVELGRYPYDVRGRLNGCGLVIVNPPWRFEESLASGLDELRQRLAPEPGGQTRLEWLTPRP